MHRNLLVWIASIVAVLVTLGIWWLVSDDSPAAIDRSGEVEVDRPDAPRAVPAEYASLHDKIVALERDGHHAQAAEEIYTLLRHLAGRWGAESPDLVPYYYNFAWCLYSAGRREEAGSVLIEALQTWPRALSLQVLDASLRIEDSLARGQFDGDLLRQLDGLLRSHNWPELRGLKLEPSGLLVQHAEIALLGGRVRRARQAIDSALELESIDAESIDGPSLSGGTPAERQRRARMLLVHARTLLGEGSPGRARPVLEVLAASVSLASLEDLVPEIEYWLGHAELDSGHADRAVPRLRRLLERVETAMAEGSEAGEDARRLLRARLRISLARGERELGRSPAAASTLLPLLAQDPYAPRALRELSACVEDGVVSAALRSRAKEVERRLEALDRARVAERSSSPSAAAYWRALSALEVGRIDLALEDLESGLEASPSAPLLSLELSRLERLLGRADLARETLERGVEASGSPLLLIEGAIVAATLGEGDRARKLLIDPRLAVPSVAEQARLEESAKEELGRLLARRVRCYLELGQGAAAREIYSFHPVTEDDPEGLILGSAELALLDKRLLDAEARLSLELDASPRIRCWRGALRLARGLLSDEAEVTRADPSDLIDHWRLIRSPEYLPRERAGEAARLYIDKLEQLVARVRKLRAESKGGGLCDDVGSTAALADAWHAGGARRKALELAWLLFRCRPEDVSSYRRLARYLDDPMDLLDRYSISVRGLERFPDDAELVEARREVERRLGI